MSSPFPLRFERLIRTGGIHGRFMTRIRLRDPHFSLSDVHCIDAPEYMPSGRIEASEFETERGPEIHAYDNFLVRP